MYPIPIGNTPPQATGLSSLTPEQQDPGQIVAALSSVKPELVSTKILDREVRRIVHDEPQAYIATTEALYHKNYLTPEEFVKVILHPYNNADDSAILAALGRQNDLNLEGLNLVEQADEGPELFQQLRKAGCMNLEGLQALANAPNKEVVSFALQLPIRFGLHGLGEKAINEIVGIFQHIDLFNEQVTTTWFEDRPTPHKVEKWIKEVCGNKVFNKNTPEPMLRWNKEVFAKVLEVFRNRPGTAPEDRQNAVYEAIEGIEILRIRNRIRRPTTHLAL